MTRKIEAGIEPVSNRDYIAAIGASAGGLGAINEFFDNMPADSNLSFIVIQHLSPDHKSLMAELVAKHTSMKIFVGEDGMVIKPNSIYLLPEKKVMTLRGNTIQLRDKVRDHHPIAVIDILFESLAEQKKDKAIGIVLSGTGTDGTRGLEAIKAQNGIAIVQEPTSAEFDGMPNSAISTGCVDIILPPESIPLELLDFIKEAPLIRSFNLMNAQDETTLYLILDMVNRMTGHNFSNYKRPTLDRRLAKRMTEINIRSVSDYYRYLTENPEEVNKLSQEFLINVTRFFRDEEAFEVIRTKVIPGLFQKKESGDTIKVWVVASSTGEEVYTFAMLLEEFMQDNHKQNINIKIFATDIDQAAVDAASKGLYSEDAMKYVSPERRRRFFMKEGDAYRVIPSIRKMVVIARHDIIKDPPFGQIDLLSCRNMLIYMDQTLQRRVSQKFLFALNENGFLFLGPSENVASMKDTLEEFDKKWKIYRCVNKAKLGDYETFINPSERSQTLQNSGGKKTRNALQHLPEIFSETILEDHSYAGFYVDREGEVKQAIGNFKNFISFPEDKFNFNLLKLVPGDLSLALNSALRKAAKDNERIVQNKVKVKDGNRVRLINIIVKPFLQPRNYLQPFLFVILEETKTSEVVIRERLSNHEESSERVKDLMQELDDTKESLQALVEEVESANEELQTSNEEIISANEELQSTNEELQSLNEELHTVNTEHQQKIRELIDLNDDLNNYFFNSEIGQILVDKNLVIRKFTPIVKKQVNLIESDIGRSISDISINFRSADFTNEIKQVMSSGKKVEREILMEGARIFLMRIAPYVRQDKKVDGVVISFVDISEARKLGETIQAVFNTSTNGIMVNTVIQDKHQKAMDLEFVAVNKAAGNLLGVEESSLIGKKMSDSFPEMAKELINAYNQITDSGKAAHFELFNAKEFQWFDVVCVKMMGGLLTTFTDITERRQAADLLNKGYMDLQVTTKKLEVANEELEKSNFDLLQFASVASHDLKEPLRKIQAYGNLFLDKVQSKLDNTESKYLEKVITSANRMQLLVDDILTLSKLSNNELEKQPTDLKKIVTRIQDDLEITIKEKNAEITVENLPVINAVSAQMHQLFQNLITNALKFTTKKKPHIKVYQEKVSEELKKKHGLDGDHVCIVVEDNGIGFENQYREKIFGIFQKLNGSNFQGTGIGLAICKKIVENHDGIITVESEVDNGSKFIVVLPK